jgi:hypothetical protein
MRCASWITDATSTNFEYVILIAFPRQHWFREWASVLRFKYIVSLVEFMPRLLQTGGTVRDFHSARVFFGRHAKGKMSKPVIAG